MNKANQAKMPTEFEMYLRAKDMYNKKSVEAKQQFLRMVAFIVVSIFYVAFWLNLAILFSIQFRQGN